MKRFAGIFSSLEYIIFTRCLVPLSKATPKIKPTFHSDKLYILVPLDPSFLLVKDQQHQTSLDFLLVIITKFSNEYK